MLRKKQTEQKPDAAQLTADRHKKIAEEAEHLGLLRKRLAIIIGHLNGPTDDRANIVVSFSDGREGESLRYSLYFGEERLWTTLCRTGHAAWRPILVAAETIVRQQIAASEGRLREFGVTNI